MKKEFKKAPGHHVNPRRVEDTLRKERFNIDLWGGNDYGWGKLHNQGERKKTCLGHWIAKGCRGARLPTQRHAHLGEGKAAGPRHITMKVDRKIRISSAKNLERAGSGSDNDWEKKWEPEVGGVHKG